MQDRDALLARRRADVAARRAAATAVTATGTGARRRRRRGDRRRRPPADRRAGGLWFGNRIAPGDAAIHRPTAVRIVGPLDLPALRSALDAVVARHLPLRCTFPLVDDAPVARVGPAATVRLGLHDVPTDADALRLAVALTARPFDLAREPGFRAALVRIGTAPGSAAGAGTGTHLLVLAAHHVVMDGWSEEILRRDLATAYDAAASGDPSRGPAPLAFTWADWTRWESDRRHSGRDEALLETALAALADLPPAPDLRGTAPTDGATGSLTSGARCPKPSPPDCDASATSAWRGRRRSRCCRRPSPPRSPTWPAPTR